MRYALSTVVLVVMLTAVSAVEAGWPRAALADMPLFVETYDVSPPVPCDGLHRNGVRYAFTVGGTASTDCLVGTGAGPGPTNNITPPNMEGTADGILRLTFDVPTTKFGFGVAQSVSPGAEQVIVTLDRPGRGRLRETVTLTTTPDPNFVGGRYDYNGPAVKSVTIAFSNVESRFALDNVRYFRPLD